MNISSSLGAKYSSVKEMDFWTKEEYLKFSEAVMDKPRSYYAFEMLYWCGMRSGDAYGKIRLKLEQIQ